MWDPAVRVERSPNWLLQSGEGYYGTAQAQDAKGRKVTGQAIGDHRSLCKVQGLSVCAELAGDQVSTSCMTLHADYRYVAEFVFPTGCPTAENQNRVGWQGSVATSVMN